MPPCLPRALPLIAALALTLITVPARADSTSSASSASSASVGSSSTSIEKSSNSSSTKDRVAQGHYTIIEMAAVAEQPDLLRLRLQALAAVPGLEPAPGVAREFVLLLPRPAAERAQLATGQTISAAHRPYGLALAALNTAGEASPFFLVLDDDWYRELESRPVVI